MSQTIRPQFHTSLANIIVEDIQLLRSRYYYYLGKTDVWSNTLDEPSFATPIDSLEEDYNIRNNIVFMKKITGNDVSLAVPRYNWTSGIVYDRWDSGIVMDGKKYYVMTEDYKVYKCLDNNGGIASTVAPSGNSYSIITTADGYLWKYMFTIPLFKRTKFLNSTYIPVQKSSTDSFYNKGSIETVSILNQGSGYSEGSPPTISVTGTTHGSGATAIIASVGTNGQILTLTKTASGSNYDYGAGVRIVSATGSGAVLGVTYDGSYGIDTISIVSPGTGYSTSDTIQIYVGQADLTPVMDSAGSVVDVIINDPGAGYVGVPTLNFSGSGGTSLYPGNTGPKLEAVVLGENLGANYNTGGSIQRVAIKDPGQNYMNVSAPYITVAGDGTGALFTPTVVGGKIVDVVIDNPGSGYTYATLTVEGTGTDADIRAIIGLNDYVSDQSIVEQTTVPGAIYAVYVSVQGTGYGSATTVTIIGDGAGATATADVQDGKIINIRMTNYGQGYTHASVVIDGGIDRPISGNTDAVARVILSPRNGHGFDAIEELNARTLSISSSLGQNSTLKAMGQEFRQYGLIKDPLESQSENFAKIESEIICFKATFSSTTGLLVDEVLISDDNLYRVIDIDGSNVFLQGISNTISSPASSISSLDGSRTYSITAILTTPTINKYTGSLMFLSNDPPFQFTDLQNVAVKTYIKL